MQAIKNLVPEQSVSLRILGDSVIQPQLCGGVLSLPHVCSQALFPDCSGWAETRRGAQLFSLCWHSVPSRNCWAKDSISPERFTRVVQTQSGFFFFWVIIKNSCQILSVRGKKYTKSEVQLDQPFKKYQLEWSRNLFHFFNFLHLTGGSCTRRKSLLAADSLVQPCSVLRETVHD